jgi:hypothetical protein
MWAVPTHLKKFKNLKTEAAGSSKLVTYLSDYLNIRREMLKPENLTQSKSVGTTNLEY